MTLEETIECAKEVARTYSGEACAVELMQIAEWLSLLKVYTDTGMAKEVQRARHEMHGWQLEWKRETERREGLEAENAKLRELVCDMLVDEERGHNDDSTFDEHVERANELGVEFRA